MPSTSEGGGRRVSAIVWLCLGDLTGLLRERPPGIPHKGPVNRCPALLLSPSIAFLALSGTSGG